MATNQNKPLQTAAVLPEPEVHTQNREKYENFLHKLTALKEKLKNTTEEEVLKELSEDIKKLKQDISRQKYIYKKEIENRMQKLGECSDGTSQHTLEALENEKEEISLRPGRFNLHNELQRLKDRIADLEGTQDTSTDLNNYLSKFKYKKKCVEEEITAKGALEKLQAELDSIVKEEKKNPEKPSEDQTILDDLNDFVKKHEKLQGYFADIEKKKGKEAVPKTLEDYWELVSGFEGFQGSIIGKKIEAAKEAKKRLERPTELEAQISTAGKRYKDAVDKRQKALGQNRTGAHKRKQVPDEDKSDH